MHTLWRIEQLIKDLDDDPEAWQRVCDVIRTLRGFSAEDSANCATIEEYIQKVYLPAVEYAHITHTIETVPVYVISKSREIEPKPILLSNGPDQAKLCPVFFSYDYAEKICTGLDNGAPHPFIARIPFFALLDPKFGLLGRNENIEFAMQDDRAKTSLLCFKKEDAVRILTKSIYAQQSDFFERTAKKINNNKRNLELLKQADSETNKT